MLMANISKGPEVSRSSMLTNDFFQRNFPSAKSRRNVYFNRCVSGVSKRRYCICRCLDESCAKTEVIHNLTQQKLFSLAHRNLKVCFRSAFFLHMKHRLWELLIWEFYMAYMSSYYKRNMGSFLKLGNIELHVGVISFFDIHLHVTV